MPFVHRFSPSSFLVTGGRLRSEPQAVICVVLSFLAFVFAQFASCVCAVGRFFIGRQFFACGFLLVLPLQPLLCNSTQCSARLLSTNPCAPPPPLRVCLCDSLPQLHSPALSCAQAHPTAVGSQNNPPLLNRLVDFSVSANWQLSPQPSILEKGHATAHGGIFAQGARPK